MNDLPKSDLLRFVERAFELAQQVIARYSSKYSKRRYTHPQHVVLLCLKVKKTTTYRDLVDELIEMPRIRDALNLDSIPAPSTLCKAFSRLEMAVWRVLLRVSLVGGSVETLVGCHERGAEYTARISHKAFVRIGGSVSTG
jgi:hypothetical protein